jgi:serine phosphatase RsbU (regulator of sigma subunit)
MDPATGDLTLCNAGHVPLVLVHPDGSTEALGEGSGLPLGVVRPLERTTASGQLIPGSVAILVTDGVVESRAHDLDVGIERLCRRASELRDKPLPVLVDALAELADKSMRDDVTILAARLS